jgi:hypothetical protein
MVKDRALLYTILSGGPFRSENKNTPKTKKDDTIIPGSWGGIAPKEFLPVLRTAGTARSRPLANTPQRGSGILLQIVVDQLPRQDRGSFSSEKLH